MMRYTFFLAVVFAASACQNNSKETLILEAETKLTMPKNADSLHNYNRYYAISGETATGVFIRSEGGPGKVEIVATNKDLPFVADGGCGVVEVRLDLKTKGWERPFCHGM